MYKQLYSHYVHDPPFVTSQCWL